MMRVRIRLFGTLKRYVSDYDPEHGLEIEIPDGAKVRDLLAHLEIPKSNTPVVTINNRITKIDDELVDGSWVNLIQLAHGG
jgi:sulfur carrier protein ThiS